MCIRMYVMYASLSNVSDLYMGGSWVESKPGTVVLYIVIYLQQRRCKGELDPVLINQALLHGDMADCSCNYKYTIHYWIRKKPLVSAES
jgi:hypothetical protein